MSGLFESALVVDLILGLILVEGIALAVLHARTKRGPSVLDLLPNLMSGACLLIALRAALLQAWWGYVAAALLAAFIAHGADLVRRFR